MNKELLEYFKQDELAANVWSSKYAAKGETNPDQMHRRMAKEFARVEERFKEEELPLWLKYSENLSEYGKARDELNEESIFNLFKDFKYIVPQGSIMQTLGTNIIASLSNCWVNESPYDSYAGILKSDAELAFYYKRRGGVGQDISNLRPSGTDTKNTAKTTTGAVSFMHRFSNTTREVAMNGRRGALMLSISINHPDVMDFIKIKRDGTSVTGANISIRLTNDFMKAVENDEDYWLTFPCGYDISGFTDREHEPYNELVEHLFYNEDENHQGDIVYIKRIKAKEYWDEIIVSAKNYAEPGLMYWDNALDYDPAAVYERYTPVCTNPCGEQYLNANDSCRLMALNLFSFIDEPFTDNAQLNERKLYEVAYEHCRLGDDLIDLELEYIQRIIDKIKYDPEPDDVKRPELELWQKSYTNTKAGRRIGLGITALADMLAALNLKYDSEKALKVIERVMSIKMEAELDCSIDLAILRGSFDGWDKNLEFPKSESQHKLYGNKFFYFLQANFSDQVERLKKYGRRNVSFSTIAPTGSVSILTQTSSGCEPVFMPFYMRRKKINPSEADIRVDFIDEIGDSWQEFPVLHEKFKDWIKTYLNNWENVIPKEITKPDINNLTQSQLQMLFESSPWYKATANDIDWQKRNEIQAILQKYTTNAISSTINLPATVTEQEVSDIYFNGWKLGLKGQTVYVEGSRSGVLVDSSKKDNLKGFTQHDAPKRPKELDAEVLHITSKGERFTVVVGLLEGKPYEIFCLGGEQFKNHSKGKVEKKSKGRYTFDGQDFNFNITDEEVALTRMISISLRHGANIKYVVEQLNKADGTIVSFSKAIARTLKKFIPEGEKSTLACNDCGGTNVVFEEGCSKCKDCGSSKCG